MTDTIWPTIQAIVGGAGSRTSSWACRFLAWALIACAASGPTCSAAGSAGVEVRMGFPGGGAIMNVDRGALVDGFALIAG